jgi:3-hydroxybutyryl-CoA dehydratase
MILGGFISSVIANKLPGPGSIYLEQSLNFKKPAFIGDTVNAIVEIIEINEDKGIYKLSTICENQNNDVLLTGRAVIMKR